MISSEASIVDVQNDVTGWEAELTLGFERGPDRTVVRRKHKGPLTMQRPFYPEGATAHVYLLHPPGGVVGGDRLSIRAHCSPDAKGLLTTPGATKFYRSDGDVAHILQSLELDGGSLEWFPQENIFFSGSKVQANTVIKLGSESNLAWWEINCFGRGTETESFRQGSVCTVLELYLEDSLLLRDRLLVSDQLPLSMSSGFRGKSVSGTLLLGPVHRDCIDSVRKTVEHQGDFSATWLDSILVVRYLGSSAEDAKAVFADVWSSLRLALNKTSPVVPRIWAT